MKTSLRKLTHRWTNKVVQFVQENTGKILTQGQCTNITGALVRGYAYNYELEFCTVCISFSPTHSSLTKVTVDLHIDKQGTKTLEFLC
jgi:hypothetical protein